MDSPVKAAQIEWYDGSFMVFYMILSFDIAIAVPWANSLGVDTQKTTWINQSEFSSSFSPWYKLIATLSEM